MLPRKLALIASGATVETCGDLDAFTDDTFVKGNIDDVPPRGQRCELFSKRAQDINRGPSAADTFVFHDTGGHTWTGMVNNSNARCRSGRCLGVTFTIDHQNGTTRQHHDLRRRSQHAGFVNHRAHGVEVINLFDPRKHRPNTPEMEIIAARWFPGGKIISPTPAQMESGWRLIRFLSLLSAKEGGGLVMAFPQLHTDAQGQWYPFSQVPDIMRHQGHGPPGVYAHGHLSNNRADGYLITAYCLLRSRGYSPAAAYDRMKSMSASTVRINGRWYAEVPSKGVGAGFGVAAAGVLVAAAIVLRG